MKQTEVVEKVIGNNHFYIRPFPAFTAANISGELASLIAPMLGSLAPLVGKVNGTDSTGNIMDTEVDIILPAITDAFSNLSGDQFERLMKKLLINSKNVSVESEATNWKVTIMSYDIANEVFCGSVEDMFILCWEVIKINYGGFFGKLGAQFGKQQEAIQTQAQDTKNTENLI